MSTYNAIHDLSETLRRLLANRLNRPGQTVTVTVDSPHKESSELPRVNLFLYQILPDPTRRNSIRIPSGPPANNRQEFVAEPLALNFRYLLTAFAEHGLSEHRLLGESMQVFHEHQSIDQENLYGTLSDSDIRPPRVQLVMQSLDLESINNIWGSNVALLRASVAYEASMVFIEPTGPRPSIPLVMHEPVPNLIAIPYVESLFPIAAKPGEKVKVYGANLSLPSLRVSVGGQIAKLQGLQTRVGTFEVPADAKPGRQPVFLKLERFQSNSIEFEVLSP